MASLKHIKSIVISRTDSIGDVCLTLPLAGILKEKYPEVQIYFLGNIYTKPVIQCCSHVDEIWEWAELQKLTEAEQVTFLKLKNVDVFIHVFPKKEIAKLAKKARIPHRIGTSHRLCHFLTCNHRPSFTRKNSDLHESQLNTKLLSPLNITQDYSLDQLHHYAGFTKIQALKSQSLTVLSSTKKTIILHAKSQGSAREWGINNFINLALELDPLKYTICFTGTEKEGVMFRNEIPKRENILDLTGKMNLEELISFIKSADILIAASTGPLHLAGLCGIRAIGLFSMQRPTYAGRWRPLGNKVFIVEEKIISPPTQPLNIPLRDVIKALEQGS